jgi:hypothetical protein
MTSLQQTNVRRKLVPEDTNVNQTLQSSNRGTVKFEKHAVLRTCVGFSSPFIRPAVLSIVVFWRLWNLPLRTEMECALDLARHLVGR